MNNHIRITPPPAPSLPAPHAPASHALADIARAFRATRDIDAMAAAAREKLGIEITADPALVAGFASDESHLPGFAECLARPKTIAETAAIAALCRHCGLPLTVSSGRTNLTGSATPEGGMIMNLAALAEPAFSVDETARAAIAPVGMLLEDFRKTVLSATASRLCFPVDPTSRAEATIGGAIACNASGFVPGAAGAMRDWVEALRVVLPDGSLVAAKRGEIVSQNGVFIVEGAYSAIEIPAPNFPRPAIKNAAGPFSAENGEMDFIDFIIGSEGIYGIVVSATLRLAPRPEAFMDFFFSLPSERDAVKTRLALEAHLPALSALEYFGPNCRKYMDHEARFFRGSDPVAIYLQAPVSLADSDAAAEEWFERVCGLGAGIDPDAVIMLDNDRDRALFMEARHSLPARSLEHVVKRGAFTLMTDAVVPPERFQEFLDLAHAAISAAGIDYLAFGHLGDCHLHFSLMPLKEQIPLATSVYETLITKAAELGGVYSGEHGTGKRKRGDFAATNGAAGTSQIRAAKSALDPEFLLNRGNVITPPHSP